MGTFSSHRKWAPTASVMALSEIVRASKTSSEQVTTVRIPVSLSKVTPVCSMIGSTTSKAISWNLLCHRFETKGVCATAQIATRLAIYSPPFRIYFFLNIFNKDLAACHFERSEKSYHPFA